MKTILKRALAPALGALSLLALTGCYAYPVGYAGGGYGYYAARRPRWWLHRSTPAASATGTAAVAGAKPLN